MGRLWEADDPYHTLADFWAADPIPGAGLWLPAAVLHLRDPQRFAPWDEGVRAATPRSTTAWAPLPPAERYRLFNEARRLAAATAPAASAGNAGRPRRVPRDRVGSRFTIRRFTIHDFRGFCADTFHSSASWCITTSATWMERQRERYRFAVREPLLELCRAWRGGTSSRCCAACMAGTSTRKPRSGRR